LIHQGILETATKHEAEKELERKIILFPTRCAKLKCQINSRK